jgi:hypothetical protein
MAADDAPNPKPPKDFKAFWRRLEERIHFVQRDAALRAMTDKNWEDVLRHQGSFRALEGVLNEINAIESGDEENQDFETAAESDS